jgi:exopolysaccharide biosynthesis polyprenyl glycosylphosphotransferase
MVESRIKLYQIYLRLIDVTSCLVAFFGSLYYSSTLPFMRSLNGVLYVNEKLFFACMLVVPSIIVIHLVYFSVCSVYNSIYYLPGLKNQIFMSGTLLGVDCLLIFILQYLIMPIKFPDVFYLHYWILGLGLILVLRFLSGLFIKYYIEHCNKYINILILGSNQRACNFFNFVHRNRMLGYKVVGFMDDENYCGQDIPIIAKLADFDRVLRENDIDRGVVFLPIRSYYDQIISIIDRASNQGIALQFMANIFEYKDGYASPAIMGNFFGILYDALPLNDWRLTFKRGFDIVFSLVLLVVCLPLMLGVAACIKLRDGGPVFFSQVRVGYRKHRFRMLKFRSMVVGAEVLQTALETQNEMTGPVFKIKNDPRMTGIGRFMRRYHIDELPQLVNVLLGDMSIVGPRPLAVRDYSGFSEDWLRRRFSVRPGLTCYWQCRKNRNDLPFEDWMRLDMEYIDNWNLTEDMKICLKTVAVVLSGNGR